MRFDPKTRPRGFSQLSSVNQWGQSGLIRVLQTAGSLTITWGAAYKSAGGIGTVNLSGINNAIDYFAFYAHSSSEIVISPQLNVS